MSLQRPDIGYSSSGRSGGPSSRQSGPSDRGSVGGSQPNSSRASEHGTHRGSSRGSEYDGGSERGSSRHQDWSTGRNSHGNVGARRTAPDPNRQMQTLRPPNPRGSGPRQPPPKGQLRPPPPRQGPPQRFRPPGPPMQPGPPRFAGPPQASLPAPRGPQTHTQIHRHGDMPPSMPPIVEEPASRTNTAGSTASRQAPPPGRESIDSARSGPILRVMDVTDYANRVEIKPAANQPNPRGVDSSSQTELLMMAEDNSPRLKTPKTPDNMAHKGIGTSARKGRKKQRVVLDEDSDESEADTLDLNLEALLENESLVDDEELPVTKDYFRVAKGRRPKGYPVPSLPGNAPSYRSPTYRTPWTDNDLRVVMDKYTNFPLNNPAIGRPAANVCAHCNRQYPAQQPVGMVKIQRKVGRKEIYWFESKEMQCQDQPGGCPHNCCGCCHQNLVRHRRSMAELPKEPVIDVHVGVDKDDPHLSKCFCGRPNSPEMLSDSTYLGYSSENPRGVGPPLYPLNTHHDVFAPGPSKLFYPGGLYDRDNEDEIEDYKRFLQTHRRGEPLAAGEYDPGLLDNTSTKVPIMSDDVSHAAHNYHQAIEKLNQHITNINNVGTGKSSKTVTFAIDY